MLYLLAWWNVHHKGNRKLHFLNYFGLFAMIPGVVLVLMVEALWAQSYYTILQIPSDLIYSAMKCTTQKYQKKKLKVDLITVYVIKYITHRSF